MPGDETVPHVQLLVFFAQSFHCLIAKLSYTLSEVHLVTCNMFGNLVHYLNKCYIVYFVHSLDGAVAAFLVAEIWGAIMRLLSIASWVAPTWLVI